MMIKRKIPYEKAVNYILNDEYKDNMILMHYDHLEDKEPDTIESSRVISRPNRKPQSGNNHQGIRTMKQVEKVNNIFDEDSIDMGNINVQKSGRKMNSRKSIKDLQNNKEYQKAIKKNQNSKKVIKI